MSGNLLRSFNHSTALKHYTSKLQTFSDLETIESYGFRGEALSSLCAVCSSVRITTCTEASKPRATRLEYDAIGKITSKARIAGTKGTTVTLTKIFEGRLPVRRLDLVKNCKREFAKCVSLLQAYGIIKLGVKIIVSNTLTSGYDNFTQLVFFSTKTDAFTQKTKQTIFNKR